MGATLSVIKTLFIPALIAFAAYVLLTFVIVPLWQRYRHRCSHYLPLDSLSNQTSSLRNHVQNSVGRLALPSNWNLRLGQRSAMGGGGLSLGNGFGAGGLFGRQATMMDDDLLSDDDVDDADFVIGEEGEELGEIRHGGTGNQEPPRGGQAYSNTSRLSRDLEQGFMDDSDEDETPAR